MREPERRFLARTVRNGLSARVRPPSSQPAVRRVAAAGRARKAAFCSALATRRACISWCVVGASPDALPDPRRGRVPPSIDLGSHGRPCRHTRRERSRICCRAGSTAPAWRLGSAITFALPNSRLSRLTFRAHPRPRLLDVPERQRRRVLDQHPASDQDGVSPGRALGHVVRLDRRLAGGRHV